MNRSVIPVSPLPAGPHRPAGRAAARAVTAIVALAILLGTSIVLALPGQASVITGAITSITTTATQTQQYDRVDLACTWAVPNGSKPGDTFTMQLPSQLRWYGASTFTLKSPDGQAVAIAQIDTHGLVTFTLTSYVLTHPVNVHGDCTFSTQYAVATTGENVTLNFVVGSEVIPVEIGTGTPCTQNCSPAHSEATKSMWWADGTQQSARSRIEAPPTTADISTVTLTDTPGPGLAIDCTSVSPAVGKTLDPDGLVLQPGDAAMHPAQVVCSSTSLSVKWTGLPPGEYTEVELTNIVTDPTLARYTNTGTVTINGFIAPVGSHLARTDGGGTGVGSTPTPSTTTPPTTPPTTPSTTTAPTTATTTAPTETAHATPPRTTPPRTTPPRTTTPTQTGGQHVTATAPVQAPAPTVAQPTVRVTLGGQPPATPTLAFTGASTLPSVLLALMLLGLGAAALALRARVERPSPQGSSRQQ
jgi:hypothetical protein